MTSPAILDVHQHLWPEAFLEELRSGIGEVRLDGWTLHLPGEPPFEVDPVDHDVAARLALDSETELIGVSLSSPLGIEYMDPAAAAPLLDAWHVGVMDLPTPFRPWSAVNLVDPDLTALASHLDGGFVGLQLPATAIASPAAVELLAPILQVCERAGKPVLIHPGPAPKRPETSSLPPWWAAVVDYTAQLNAAWWAWQFVGRTMFSDLRVCFAAAAGLAPAHHERYSVRGGGTPPPIDQLTFIETSSYGPRALDAVIRVLGIDVIVHGTDRPYAGPTDLKLGDAATHAVRCANPIRLLEGGPL